MIVYVVAAVAILGNMLVGAFDCTHFNSNMGATFDLSELQRSAGQPSYKIEDGDIPCTPNVESNYTYNFNVCGAITGYVEKECVHVLGDRLRTASALQINKRGTADENDDWCYVVGYYNQDLTSIKLLDSGDPTKGVVVSYKGDYCNGGKQRQFHLELSCADRLNPTATHAYELAGCEYTAYMPSVYGCPLECPVANRALCGGQGHCAYDSDKQSARCYCNRGYGGVDCTESDTEAEALNYSPALLGLIITLFVIIALLVMGVVMMIKQVSAYRDDIANYQVLKGGDEDGVGGAGSSPGGRRGGLNNTDGDSIFDTVAEVLSPLTDAAGSAMSKATAYIGHRAAARSAAANSMARQGQFNASLSSGDGMEQRQQQQQQQVSQGYASPSPSPSGDVSSVTL